MKFKNQLLCDAQGKTVIKTFHSTVKSGKRMYNEHHHTECELSLFLSGSGLYTVKNKTYEFKSGDVFLFNSDEVHCITDIYSDLPFDLLNIHFEPRILWSKSEFTDTALLKIFFARNENFENRISRNNPATEKIKKLISSLENEISEKQQGYELMSVMTLNYILITLLREYNYVEKDNVYSNYANFIKQIDKALNYIDENLENDITLDMLSKITSMSSTYFSTVFKKFNGITPWEYITIKRVEKSIELIKNTCLTKLDIAYSCGFKSSSNFYKAFKKVTGKTPSHFN